MSLSTALIPQQRLPERRSAQIFARFIERRYGHWSHMRHRSIGAVVEQQATRGNVRCVGRAGGTLQTQRSISFLALQRQQLLALHREDYRIYPQSVDLEAFFGADQSCDKVSDVCLLNDHFILVKMPNDDGDLKPPPADPQRKLGSRLPRCFKCNRGSRVSPIMEERDEPQPSAHKPWGSRDAEDEEIFASTTRILPAHSHQQLQAISLPPRQDSVIVEQPLPQRRAPVASLQLQLETLQMQPPPPYPHPISRGPLHWFLWPFRRRSANRPKAQLAAVHKTYFIRWNKPPDTLWHGYGVERIPAERLELRRCRSAIF